MAKNKDTVDTAADDQKASLFTDPVIHEDFPKPPVAAEPAPVLNEPVIEPRKPRDWEPPHIHVPVASKFKVTLGPDTTVTVVFDEPADANYFYDLLVPHAAATAVIEPDKH